MSVCHAVHTSKRAREEADSEAEDMAVETLHSAGFSGHVSASACAADSAGGAARKQARQQEAAAPADSPTQAADGPEAAAGEAPPPQHGDCIVFVSI